MKTQNRWQFGTAVLLVALWVTAGCANKQNVAENEQADGFSETAQAADAEGTPPATDGATDAEVLADADPNAAKDAATQTAENTAAPGAAGDPAMESLFEQSSQDPAATQDPNFDALAKSDGIHDGPGAANADPSAVHTEEAPAIVTDAAVGTGLSDPATTTDAQAFSGTPTFTSTPKAYAGAILPKIPARALNRKGANLNRYYFLRQGDTPKSVSELVYGGATHAGDLKNWNKGRWIPGKVVYYNSPTQADDAQMVSFYDERGLTAEEYKVGKGDSMSTIAKKKLGSVSSWKEVAIVNGLSSPDTLHRGQTVKLFTNLGAAASAVAAVTPEPIVPPLAVEPPHPVTPPPAAATTQVPVVNAPNPMDPGMAADPLNDLNKVKKKPRKEGLNLGKLISQNSFSLAMGLGVALLVVSLMMINRRKRAGSSIEEFNEDAFAAPGKEKAPLVSSAV